MSDEAELGPKLRALTARQRAFVLVMVEFPGLSAAEAARRAGYSDVKQGAKVHGHHLIHDDRILAAIQEVAGQLLRSSSIAARHVVARLLDHDDPKIALKAAGMLLDRGGHAVQQNININQTVTDNSGKAIMDRIRALASKHGLDAQKLLNKPATIEADFTEVSDD